MLSAGALSFALVACGDRGAVVEKPSVTPDETPRIVSLSREISRLLVQFGLGSEIVGIGSESLGIRGLSSSAVDLGDTESVDTASIEALDPSLVLALGERPPISVPCSENQSGMSVHVFAPTTVNEAVESIHELGAILDRESRAKAIVRELTREISDIATDRDGRSRLRVVWILERVPLTVVGNRGLLHELLELAGGEMALHRIEGEAVEVTANLLETSDPDVVLDSSPRAGAAPFEPHVRIEAVPAWIARVPALDLLDRVRVLHALLYPMDSTRRPSAPDDDAEVGSARTL